MTCWQNVLLTKFLVGKMSCWQNVPLKKDTLTKWRVENISFWQNVSLTKCPVDKIACRSSVQLDKMPGTHANIGKERHRSFTTGLHICVSLNGCLPNIAQSGRYMFSNSSFQNREMRWTSLTLRCDTIKTGANTQINVVPQLGATTHALRHST